MKVEGLKFLDWLVTKDGFDRDVWCLLGLPFDALSMSQAVLQVRAAAETRTQCFISTANLNFLIGAKADESFRESVIDSDLSLVDGMPLVWLARLLDMPIRERVAGSDLFEALRWEGAIPTGAVAAPRPLTVFFFGGPESAAEQACARLNTDGANVRCVGWYFPGYVRVEDMSGEGIIAEINASGADFLVVSLGARKGQAWILRNLSRLRVPVVSHLGAVVNFLAGSVRRAPTWMRRTGLEWAWRIKEEPTLVGRYARDGLALLRLVLTRVVPLVAWRWSRRLRSGSLLDKPALARVLVAEEGRVGESSLPAAEGGCRVALAGALLAGRLDLVRHAFREASASGLDVTVDLDDVTDVDGAFLGLLMVLRKETRAAGHRLRIENASRPLHRVFWLNAATYLLE